MSARERGSIVVDVISGGVGCIVERFHPTSNPYYMDWRVRFPGQTYRIVKDRHLREPMAGEVMTIRRQFAAERPKP